MKILFVCRGNVGRSQMAEALFSNYSNHKVYSAGTKVYENEGEKIIVMAEPETIPEFLRNNNKAMYWEIEDPKGKSIEDYRLLIKELKILIQKLIMDNNL